MAAERAGVGRLTAKLMKFKLQGSFLAWTLSKTLEVACDFVFINSFILS